MSIARKGDDVIEEGRSTVVLKCVSDANPPGRVFWKKFGGHGDGGRGVGGGGGDEARQYVDTLELKPVTRKDSGTYLCQAENSIGLSAEEPAEIDVMCKYYVEGKRRRTVLQKLGNFDPRRRIGSAA